MFIDDGCESLLYCRGPAMHLWESAVSLVASEISSREVTGRKNRSGRMDQSGPCRTGRAGPEVQTAILGLRSERGQAKSRPSDNEWSKTKQLTDDHYQCLDSVPSLGAP